MGVYNDMYKMGAMVIAMSDAMEILYAYAKEELLPSYLPSPEYREVSRLTAGARVEVELICEKV